jgi:hypothetical protein
MNEQHDAEWFESTMHALAPAWAATAQSLREKAEADRAKPPTGLPRFDQTAELNQQRLTAEAIDLEDMSKGAAALMPKLRLRPEDDMRFQTRSQMHRDLFNLAAILGRLERPQ